jgi:hypothetical protein
MRLVPDDVIVLTLHHGLSEQTTLSMPCLIMGIGLQWAINPAQPLLSQMASGKLVIRLSERARVNRYARTPGPKRRQIWWSLFKGNLSWRRTVRRFLKDCESGGSLVSEVSGNLPQDMFASIVTQAPERQAARIK